MSTARNLTALLLSVTALLQGCATAPVACPKLPNPPALGPVPPSYQDRTLRWLSGLPPRPTDSEPTTRPAKPGSKR